MAAAVLPARSATSRRDRPRPSPWRLGRVRALPRRGAGFGGRVSSARRALPRRGTLGLSSRARRAVVSVCSLARLDLLCTAFMRRALFLGQRARHAGSAAAQAVGVSAASGCGRRPRLGTRVGSSDAAPVAAACRGGLDLGTARRPARARGRFHLALDDRLGRRHGAGAAATATGATSAHGFRLRRGAGGTRARPAAAPARARPRPVRAVGAGAGVATAPPCGWPGRGGSIARFFLTSTVTVFERPCEKLCRT